MPSKVFKAIYFDLDTHQLKEQYTGNNYRQAYDDLRNFFKQHHFSHRQGSGYISNTKLSTADIYDLIDDLCQQFSWFNLCVNKIDVTNIGSQHDLTTLLKPQKNFFSDTSAITTSNRISSNTTFLNNK